MPNPIDFYFDFSSPYGYFASCRIDAIAEGHAREVIWRPYLMGVVMKVTGSQPLPHRPMIKDYAAHDFARTARQYDIPFNMPSPFPVASIAPCRAFYWLADRDPLQARELAQRVYAAFFVDGRNISEPDVVANVAAAMNLDREEVSAALGEPAVKERLRQETDAAIERGVFGSPFVIVDGEPFWGNDRLADVERWLETGGW